MNKETLIMLIIAIVSLLCIIWAISIFDWIMVVLLSLNALVSLCFVFLVKKNNC